MCVRTNEAYGYCFHALSAVRLLDSFPKDFHRGYMIFSTSRMQRHLTLLLQTFHNFTSVLHTNIESLKKKSCSLTYTYEDPLRGNLCIALTGDSRLCTSYSAAQ